MPYFIDHDYVLLKLFVIKINFSKIGNIFVNRKDSEEMALDYFKIHNAGKTNVSSDCSANDMPTFEKDHFS